MSDKIRFYIHVGDGSVSHGHNGVDLSGFKRVETSIYRSEEKSYESICAWLMCGLRVQPETHVLNVHYLVNRSTGFSSGS